ncbi:hypothetical protein ACWGI8_21250, partial [Streptomyces sp. NPDC054841]
MGCAPTGRLREAVERARHQPVGSDGTIEPVGVGELGLIVDFPVPGAGPEAAPFDAYDAHHWEP